MAIGGWDQASNNEPQAGSRHINLTGGTMSWISSRSVRQRARDRINPTLTIPHIESRRLSESFVNVSILGGLEDEIYGQFSANRLMWLCHDCGSFGYKLNSPRELDKCYNWHCKSRNVTIARAGDISLAIRDLALGVTLSEVFRSRQERIRNARAQRRDSRRHNT